MNDKPKVGIGVLIIRDGKVLLGKRKGGLASGTWALPGGKLDFDERLEDCAKREIKEEMGMKVDGLELISVSNDIMYNEHYVTLGFKASIASGNPVLKEPEKCEIWEWFDINNLPKPLFVATRSVIENYLSKRIYKGLGK